MITWCRYAYVISGSTVTRASIYTYTTTSQSIWHLHKSHCITLEDLCHHQNGNRILISRLDVYYNPPPPSYTPPPLYPVPQPYVLSTFSRTGSDQPNFLFFVPYRFLERTHSGQFSAKSLKLPWMAMMCMGLLFFSIIFALYIL